MKFNSQKISFVLSTTLLIISISPLINVVNKTFSKFNSSNNIDKHSKEFEEMNNIYNLLSKNQILLERGFVIALDFHTFLRSKNFNKKVLNKNIIFENIQNPNKVINKWQTNQKVSWIFSCRYLNCNVESHTINLLVNIKNDSKIVSIEKEVTCLKKEVEESKITNFGIYDCLI